MNPGHSKPWAVRLCRRGILPVVRLLYRPTIEGFENLPTEGPYLLVSNHNAGLGAAEIFSFAALWAEAFEGRRPMAAFAHPVGFKVWPISALHEGIGSIPSTYDAAYDALERGVPILVFPGGDYETLRPVWQANRVDFGGRKGFLRIAAKAGVPVVPMGVRGAHYTLPMLYRARWLAWVAVIPRLIGQKRWGISILTVVGWLAIALLPIHPAWRVFLGLLWMSSPLIFLPIVPWTIRFRVGQLLTVDALFDGEQEPDDEVLATAYEAVITKISELVNRP